MLLKGNYRRRLTAPAFLLVPAFLLSMVFLLTGCSAVKKEVGAPVDREDKVKLGFGSLSGEDAITIGGPTKFSETLSNSNVNPHLWRASLESLKFMPLISVDSSAGAILTDWYINPLSPQERLKVAVYVHGPVLQANAVEVLVHKQKLYPQGWVNVEDEEQKSTEFELENIILTKARELRVQMQKSRK